MTRIVVVALILASVDYNAADGEAWLWDALLALMLAWVFSGYVLQRLALKVLAQAAKKLAAEAAVTKAALVAKGGRS